MEEEEEELHTQQVVLVTEQQRVLKHGQTSFQPKELSLAAISPLQPAISPQCPSLQNPGVS